MRALSLYIHVPFCTRRCPYCSFYHVRADRDLESRFVDAVGEEISCELRALGDDVRLRTVYVGGGTPSALAPSLRERLFAAVEPWRDPSVTSEVTVEVNPEDVTDELLLELGACGVNRVSLGVQSMEPRGLRRLGRCGPDENRAALDRVCKRFENRSFDVLLGIPEAPPGALRDTVTELAGRRPTHFSLYCLEPGGDMGASSSGFFSEVDPDRSADEYLWACEYLAASGYVHYEVSNFALPGRESLHNRVYWEGGEYLGVGPGAHSMVDGRRFHNAPSLRDYLSRSQRERSAARIEDPAGAMGELEACMLGLRTRRGIPREWCRCPDQELADLAARGLASVAEGRVRLTDRGFLVLNEVLCRLLAGRP